MIECRNLVFKYTASENQEEKIAINDVNLQITEGEFIAILGHNGSGKSTMAKHMNALLIPTDGKMLVNKMDTSDMNNLWNIRETAGMVFQNPDNQLVATIVVEDVAFGPQNFGVSKEEAEQRAIESLKLVGLPEEFHGQNPFDLSGGQMRRVAIAGILAMQPDILVLDEPTAGLDPQGRKELMSLFKELHLSGMTIVLVTHLMDDVADYATDRKSVV